MRVFARRFQPARRRRPFAMLWGANQPRSRKGASMPRTAVASAFDALDNHARALRVESAPDLFARNPLRFQEFSVPLDDFLFDFSKHKITRETIALLVALAEARDLEGRRAALFAGEPVNNTEGRAAMHMGLRDFSNKPIIVQGVDFRREIEATRERVFAFARDIRAGAILGAGDKPFTDIVNIGIGGSDLGPAMAARALSPYRGAGPRTHFVANVDGADLSDTLEPLDLSRTLFIVSSKAFTTQETMANAASARARIGSADAIRCGRRSDLLWRSRSDPIISRNFCAAASTSTRIFARPRSIETSPR